MSSFGGMGFGGISGPSGIMGNKIPKGYSYGQIGQYTPEQQQQFGSQFEHVGPDSYLAKLARGDQSAFAESEAPAMRQFNELQGGIASRFSGMGSGARRSSGFQNTVNQASSNFAQDLASRRMDMRRNAINDLMGLSNTLLGQRPYDQFVTEKPKPFWQEALTSGASGFGQGVGKAGSTKFFS